MRREVGSMGGSVGRTGWLYGGFGWCDVNVYVCFLFLRGDGAEGVMWVGLGLGICNA